MARITKTRTNGTGRVIIYAGPIEELAHEMFQLACTDAEFQRSLLNAAIELHNARKSFQLGQQLCEMILHPEKH